MELSSDREITQWCTASMRLGVRSSTDLSGLVTQLIEGYWRTESSMREQRKRQILFNISLFHIATGQSLYQLLKMVNAGGTRTCVHLHVRCPLYLCATDIDTMYDYNKTTENPVNNLCRQMSVWRQSNISSTLNWRWTDVRLTSANVDCLLGTIWERVTDCLVEEWTQEETIDCSDAIGSTELHQSLWGSLFSFSSFRD